MLPQSSCSFSGEWLGGLLDEINQWSDLALGGFLR